ILVLRGVPVLVAAVLRRVAAEPEDRVPGERQGLVPELEPGLEPRRADEGDDHDATPVPPQASQGQVEMEKPCCTCTRPVPLQCGQGSGCSWMSSSSSASLWPYRGPRSRRASSCR